MATSTKTPNSTEEQDAAYNPGDDYYNRQFNQVAKRDELADLEAQYAAPSYEKKGSLYTNSDGDKVKKNQNSDDPEDFDDSEDASENIAAAKDREKSGGAPKSQVTEETGAGRSNFVGKLRGKGGKKKGPTAGVVGFMLLALIGVGGGSAGIASSLLINMKEIFHNDRSDGTRTNRLFSRAFMANKFNSKDTACKGIAIKCKMSTMSKDDVKKLIKEDFIVKGAEIDAKTGTDTGKRIEDDKSLQPDADPAATANDPDAHDPNARVSIEEIEFPDGEKVKTGKEFYAHADKNVSALRTSERAFNSKSAFYLNKFFDSKILNKFSFSKAKKEFPNGEGDDAKKNQDQAFNEQTGGMTEEDQRNGGLNDRVNETLNEADESSKPKYSADKAGKGSALMSAIQTICSAYKLARGAVAAVKAYQIIQLARFGLLFLQAADEIKDGRGDGPKTTYLSDNLTSYESNETMAEDDESLGVSAGDPNPKYNLSATDSQGYKVAAMGDTAGLALFAKKYILGGSGIAKDLDDTIKNVDDVVGKVTLANPGEGRERVRQFCRQANSSLAVIGATCASVIGSLTTIGAGAAGVGAFVGAALGGVACACAAAAYPSGNWGKFTSLITDAATLGSCSAMTLLAETAKDGVMALLKSTVAKSFIEKVLEEVTVGSDTKGVDAGNAIAAGVGLTLSTTATGYGLKPATGGDDGKNKEITDYITYTQPLEDTYIALEKDDARLNPLDATNQYSLVGSLVRSFNLSDVTPTSIYGNALTIAGLLPSALQTTLTGQPVSALYSQPSTAANGESGRYDCEDDDMKFIKATGDKFCSIVGVSTTEELTSAQKTINEAGQNKELKDTEMGKLLDFMSQQEDYKNVGTLSEANGGTGDDTSGDCTATSGEEDERNDDGFCNMSRQPSMDENGKFIENSQYHKYLVYCTEQRVQPWGAQAEAYEQGTDRDQDWYSGKKCTEKSTMLKYFRMFTNYCLQSGTRDGTSNCYEDDVTPAAGPLAPAGTWVMPTVGQCTSPFGQRWGTLHAGIDLSNSMSGGEPIVAPTNMKITTAGDKGDGYGYSVTARAIDGTDYSFRFGHMIAPPSVAVNQEVAKGTEIGKVGSTGDSTGAHLHFEIYAPGSPDGAYASNGSPVDPIPVLTQNGAAPPSCAG